MRKLESIADALALLNDYHDPESEAYQLRNPLMLRNKSLLGVVEDGFRKFTCHQAGYKAGTDSLRKQCERYKEKTLQSCLEHHRQGNEFAVKTAVDFIRRSIGAKEVSANTKLEYFLEN
jgi:hypothetical protein